MNFFWLECELKRACFGQICRRRKVNYEINEVTLRNGCYRPVKYDGRTLFDTDSAYIYEMYDAFDVPNLCMRRRLYNITFGVILYSYIVQ